MDNPMIQAVLDHPLMQRAWISVDETAKLLGISHVTVLRSIRSHWFVGFNSSVGIRRAKWLVSTDSIRKRVEGNTDKIDEPVEPSGNKLTEVS
jgi:hypothetical protein